MLTPLEHQTNRNPSITGKCNFRIFFAWPWYPNRRLLMCRLPFLVLWTFIAIIFLYKSLSNIPENAISENAEEVPFSNALERASATLRRETRVSGGDDYNQLMMDNRNGGRAVKETTPIVILNDTWSELHQTIPSVFYQTSTTKKTSTEYNRRSKVCILIIQSASTFVLNKRRRNHLNSRQVNNSLNILGIGEFVGPKDRSLSIPNHIRLVIEILEAHKIDYTVETTRLGLPTTLLTDESSQYSVIVIDDFLKYTKLDRWLRDQLDRHCRKNQVGVVTFLDPDEMDNNRHSVTTRVDLNTGKSVKLTTEESMTDQFPLTLKPIDKRACKKQSVACSYDYQLNDRSSILRILKRQRDFVVSASFAASSELTMPWISMSSDHVTYEPLTWAKFKRPSISAGNRFITRIPRSTRGSTSTLSTRRDNVLLSSMEADIKPKRDDYDAYESPDGIDEAGDKSHAASGVANTGITREYSKNQLQAAAAMDQNLHKSTVLDVDSYNNGKTSNRANSTMVYDESERHQHKSSGDSRSNNTATSNDSEEDYGTIEPEPEVLSMFDRGLYDGIKRVIFGRANHHWLDRVILLEAIEHLSSGRILTPLERYIQIDIDDIFVGERGKRMNYSDVDALIDTQGRFSHLIDGGFKFNLGFSGKYFKHGDHIENAGDEYLISRADRFDWFCHTWSHSKAHLMNDTNAIEMELRKNIRFAKQHRLPLIGHTGPMKFDDVALPETYAVAPHHSGVYPVHEQLYEAWRKVLNVRVTSTEEYPSLRPVSNRQAFVHKTIKVLPRQTCGLYTHTIYRDRYPGGVEKLEASIKGGELFETILHNPVNIYMTHMSNYAHDRLALSTFSALIEFVQKYTNLQLKYSPSDNGQLGPNQLAEYYFSLFPHEQRPIWTNPCKDKRHMSIWAPDKHKYCSVVPQLLIVGPQKTGTTALYSFLGLHPEFKSSHQSPVDFEEVQFFNDKHYLQGVDWYFSRFLSPKPDGATNVAMDQNEERQQQFYHFDKSATYFDDPKVAARAKSLLPEARIVILLVDPADRAYSWYQHIRAHGDIVANSMSFEQIIMSTDDNDGAGETENRNNSININNSSYGGSGESTASAGRRALRSRCLQPGYYSVHLSRWLEHFPSHQIIIIDGQWFRQNPASVMNKLQLILRVEQKLDYKNLLVFSEQKGFYCQRSPPPAVDNSDSHRKEIKCLGPSKGRKYLPMGHEIRLFLNRHYLAYNKQLARLLSDIGQPLPVWLVEAISVGRRHHVAPMVFS